MKHALKIAASAIIYSLLLVLTISTNYQDVCSMPTSDADGNIINMPSNAQSYDLTYTLPGIYTEVIFRNPTGGPTFARRIQSLTYGSTAQLSIQTRDQVAPNSKGLNFSSTRCIANQFKQQSHYYIYTLHRIRV